MSTRRNDGRARNGGRFQDVAERWLRTNDPWYRDRKEEWETPSTDVLSRSGAIHPSMLALQSTGQAAEGNYRKMPGYDRDNTDIDDWWGQVAELDIGDGQDSELDVGAQLEAASGYSVENERPVYTRNTYHLKAMSHCLRSAGWSIRRIAIHIGVAHTTIRRWLKDKGCSINSQGI